MTDDSQILVPDSFVGLYRAPGRRPAGAERVRMTQRYELCEDLACALTERARTLRWELDLAEQDVLERMQRGLAALGSGLSANEAAWVLRRLAELLDWARPAVVERPPGTAGAGAEG